eukprot:1187897-Prorocentrum_minimum.AAC.2
MTDGAGQLMTESHRRTRRLQTAQAVPAQQAAHRPVATPPPETERETPPPARPPPPPSPPPPWAPLGAAGAGGTAPRSLPFLDATGFASALAASDAPGPAPPGVVLGVHAGSVGSKVGQYVGWKRKHSVPVRGRTFNISWRNRLFDCIFSFRVPCVDCSFRCLLEHVDVRCIYLGSELLEDVFLECVLVELHGGDGSSDEETEEREADLGVGEVQAGQLLKGHGGRLGDAHRERVAGAGVGAMVRPYGLDELLLAHQLVPQVEHLDRLHHVFRHAHVQDLHAAAQHNEDVVRQLVPVEDLLAILVAHPEHVLPEGVHLLRALQEGVHPQLL